jgi:hypothetical protein
VSAYQGEWGESVGWVRIPLFDLERADAGAVTHCEKVDTLDEGPCYSRFPLDEAIEKSLDDILEMEHVPAADSQMGPRSVAVPADVTGPPGIACCRIAHSVVAVSHLLLQAHDRHHDWRHRERNPEPDPYVARLLAVRFQQVRWG